MDKNNQAVKNIRQFLIEGKYIFTEEQREEKYVFKLNDTFGSTIYVNVWQGGDNYKLLIEEIYPSCKHSILKSIGERYCSAYGNFEIGKYDLVSADNIVSEIKSTFNEKEKWCHKFVKAQ